MKYASSSLFNETKEVIAGFALWEVKSFDEALEWARKCPVIMDCTVDMGQISCAGWSSRQDKRPFQRTPLHLRRANSIAAQHAVTWATLHCSGVVRGLSG